MNFRKIFDRLGFTLAELMIVIALLAVVATVAVPSVAKYSKSISLRELDDSARAIYMAAQHEFKSKIAAGESLGSASETLSTPKRYTGDGTITPVDHISYAIFSGKLATGELINVGAIEPELAENCFVIEYNADSGDVYGVFYSTDPDEFADYKTAYNDDGGKYAAAVEKSADRVSTLGYYGLENAPATAPPTPDDIPVPSVKIINKEKLVLEVTNPLGNPDAYLAIDINGVPLVKRESGAYIVANNTATFILDTLNGNSDNISMKNLTGVVFEKPFDGWAKDDVGDYLIAPGAELNIAVTFYDPEGMAIDQTVTVKANSLFADGSSPETANIEYGRHLQNLGECDTVQTAVIKKTINFASTADNYEGWANPDVYPGRKFNSIGYKDNFQIYGLSGTEIQNMQADNGGLFDMIGVNTTISDLTFHNCSAEKDYFGYAGLLTALISNLDGSEIKFSNITAINPQVTGDFVGGLVGSADNITIENCKIYVETSSGETWDNPESDPYHNYAVKGTSCAGGLIGQAQTVNIINSYASINVISDLSSGTAGGLVGETSNTSTVIENSFAGGHTYYGIFKGTSKDSKTVSLEDNVSGMTSGGIAGKIDGDELILKGTVFSTCSVSGTNVDTAYNGTAVTDDAIVYTLGTAYKTDGASVTEIKKSADTNVKTGNEVLIKDETKFSVGKRYDLKVSSVFKYPLPYGMIMHGDWPSGSPISGFAYWENEGGAYRLHALYFNEKGEIKEITNLAQTRGTPVSEYGYAAFSVGGTASATFNIANISEDSRADSEAVKTAIKTALAAEKDLKTTADKIDVKLYAAGNVGSGTAVATVDGKEYGFAPDFYMIRAVDKTDPAKTAGTEDGVYGVRSGLHLKNIGAGGYLGGRFVQSHDILPDEALVPIGSGSAPFTGSYDGGGFEIIDMKIRVSDPGEPAGMFGTTNGATLERIVLRASAENTNFVETAPALPAAAAISALAGIEVPDESLAAVDGEGYKANVTVGERKDITFGNLLLDGTNAKDFLTTYKKYSSYGGDYQVRLSPSPTSNCYIAIMKPDNSLLREIPVIAQMDSYGNYFISIDSTIAGLIPDDPENYYILINSAQYPQGTNVAVTIGKAADHAHQFDGTYKSDGTGHWQQCTYPGCDFVQNFTGHTFLPGMYGGNSTGPDGHRLKCTVCGYLADFEEHTMLWQPDGEAGHKGECSECGYTDYSTHAHNFVGQTCTDCGFVTNHHYVLKYDDNSHWYQCDGSEGCGGYYTMGNSPHEFEYSASGNKHIAKCDVCGFIREENHISQIEELNDAEHAYRCGKCGVLLKTEAHEFKDGKCKICGYMLARPFGGIVGLAKNTAISECKVINYVLDGDQLTTEASKGTADYEFGGFYDLTHEGSITGQSYYYIYPGQKCTICHGEKTGGCPYEYEMERFIMSAENAIKARHPDYTYRFRVVLTKGGKLEHSANNAAKFYCENTEGHKGTGSPYSKDSPLLGSLKTIDGDQYFEITAQGVHDSYYKWNALSEQFGQTPPDFWEFGIYTELTSGNDYERLNATINEFEYASLLNITIGGIAGKVEIGANSLVKACETDIAFGYAKTFGGIVGSASKCVAEAEISGCKAMVNGSTKPLDKRVVRLGGILASKDGDLNIKENLSAFRNLDTSWQYVFAVAPDAGETNKYVNDPGFASGPHMGANEEKAVPITLDDFNK